MPPISSNSKAVFTIGSLLTFTGAVIYGTYQFTEARNQILNELAAIRRIQEKALLEQWTQADHERFAVKLERSNRALNLIVPAVNDRS